MLNVKKKVGRPRIYKDNEERIKYHRQKLKEQHYSTAYYNNEIHKIKCKFCNKDINKLAQTSHYTSKRCRKHQDIKLN